MCEDMYPSRPTTLSDNGQEDKEEESGEIEMYPRSRSQGESNRESKNSSFTRFLGYLSMATSTYFLLLLNFFAQGVLILNLGEVVIISIQEEKYCKSSPYLRFCCIFLFGSFIFDDLLQSISMCRWHLAVKTEKYHRPLIVRVHRTENHHHILGSEIASGLTFWHKVLNICFIILPKFIYGVALVFSGGGFIALSTNNEGILVNTMALYFIIQVDEFLLKAFVTEDMAHSLEHVPGVVVSYQHGHGCCGHCRSGCGCCGVAFAKTMTAGKTKAQRLCFLFLFLTFFFFLPFFSISFCISINSGWNYQSFTCNGCI